MRMRTIVFLAALFAAAVWAAPAQAKLVYVKNPASVAPVVYVAKDDGSKPRRLGTGRAPTISPDGQWVAFVTVPIAAGQLDTVVLQKLSGGGSQRFVMRSKVIDSLRFSPDSKLVGAIAASRRVRVYDIAKDATKVAAEGEIRGYAFSPDSADIVYGDAESDKFGAPSDLFIRDAHGKGKARRLTDTHRAANPVWGPKSIVFDRFRRRKGDVPAYNISKIAADGKSAAETLTKLKVPALTSGLVPLEVSENGRRLLSVFTGQDSEVGFTVQMRTGQTHALSTDFETGLVGFDLSADGRRILAHTGGPDPGNAHDVVVVPYGGGKPKVIVEDAAYPDWNS
jgi:Tol biopolymer transport system component